MDTKIKNYKPS